MLPPQREPLSEFLERLGYEVHVDDGLRRRTYLLNRSYFGLYVPNMIWRQLESFSTNAVCLILASERYAESDYIRDHGDFLAERRASD